MASAVSSIRRADPEVRHEVRHRFAVLLAVACVAAIVLGAPYRVIAGNGKAPAKASAKDAASDTAGDARVQELSKKDDHDVREVLQRYLDALRKRDFATAGECLDRASFLAHIDPLVATVASDSIQRGFALRHMFGVSTKDSLAAQPMGQSFAALIHYLEQTTPGSTAALTKAEFNILTTRRRGDRAYVAYELTVPADSTGGTPVTPVTHVTADQLVKVGWKWKILFTLEH